MTEKWSGGSLEMIKTKVFGRIRFDIHENTEKLEFVLPDGCVQSGIPFWHNDAEFEYDCHGYETVILKGKECRQTAFTATIPGKHTLRTYIGNEILDEIVFEAEVAENTGFVQVSDLDPRYFSLSCGTPYTPIGLNLVGCDYDRLPAGMDHFTASNNTATTGMLQWRRWFGRMQKAGVNYCRIWLSNRYTEARTEVMGIHDPLALARFDALIELARESGVRLKLCMEHWRTFSDENHFAYRRYIDPDTGRQLKDENEWFTSSKWNARWMKDIEPYLARCQNDPVVFAWELWNEIDCGEGSFESVTGFTKRMLKEIKNISPYNLAVNSLGSFDEESKQERQDCFCEMPEMDFQQVHRYLDQGAPMSICHTDPVAFSIEAVNRSRREDKPVILTETGAVNDRHVGPFRFYNSDHDGLIFMDVTYPAFFAGSAGSGHIWHWNQYVETKNLWDHFKPLADLVEGIQMDAENFISGVIENEEAWILTLSGNKHTLILVRNRADRWDKVLRDGQSPLKIENLRIPVMTKTAKVFWLANEDPGEIMAEADGVKLPPFVHGCVLQIENRQT